MKIRRNEKSCIHCHACTKHCPTLIDVEKKEVVSSPECFGCLTCVSRCPAKGALDMTAGIGEKRRVIQPAAYTLILLAVLYLIIGFAIATGNWKSQVPYEEYGRILSSDINKLGHPGR
jgi:NAD-dependent dihydropyrimidine dehydrogenase PreA subunit